MREAPRARSMLTSRDWPGSYAITNGLPGQTMVPFHQASQPSSGRSHRVDEPGRGQAGVAAIRIGEVDGPTARRARLWQLDVAQAGWKIAGEM